MGKFKVWVARQLFDDILSADATPPAATKSSGGSRDLVAGLVKRLGLRMGDTKSKDFEAPEFSLTDIQNGYNTDSYIRQGVDKYVDQIFKEGYEIFGKDTNIVNYIKLRLAFIAEATQTPMGQLWTDIAEDVVKYSNCIIVKARSQDQTQLPPGVSITGLMGNQPVAGYFCLNPTTMKVKRDKNGTVMGWQQDAGGDSGGKGIKFKPEDVIHIYYKREKGNAFGTSFLIPVLDDVRALRQAEENVLRMMYRNIYPFYHIAVGDKDAPGTPTEVSELQQNINNMDVEGGIVTTSRVIIKAVASDQVISAQPYLSYLEQRVFTGLGVPAIMFGRGDTGNRSTGDNMASEMSDRIKAIQKTTEMFINTFMIKELLMEGGYDPVLNPEQDVVFRFLDNDLDTKIKSDTNFIYQYENNAITEDEMRAGLGRDPITDRALMYQSLITQANVAHAASVTPIGANQTPGKGLTSAPTSKATTNKQTPSNQYGTKTSPKKMTNSVSMGLMLDSLDNLKSSLTSYISNCISNKDKLQNDTIAKLIDSATLSSFYSLDEIMTDAEDLKINKVRVMKAYDTLLADIKDSLKDMQDYNEVISLIDIMIDMMEQRLLHIFK